jgi:uncharacterized delta-60 repeat protein
MATMRRLMTLGLAAALLSWTVPAQATPGAPDRSFGQGGVVLTQFSAIAFASSVAVTPDGGIVAAGRVGKQLEVLRYQSEGSLDRSFGSGGKVGTDLGKAPSVGGVALDSAHRIIVAGSGDGDDKVIRYLPDGELDADFGDGGVVTLDRGTKFDAASSVAMQGRKIVVVGDAGGQFEVLRLRADGTLDTSFGTDGAADVRFRKVDGARAKEVIVDRGHILVAGEGSQGGCSGGGCTVYQVIVGLDDDGTQDETFGTKGTQERVLPDFGEICYGCDVAFAMTPSGRLLVANVNAIAEYTARGRVAWGFGSHGVVEPKGVSFSGGSALAVQPNGKILAGGARVADPSCTRCRRAFGLERFLAGGRVDRTFGDRGTVSTAIEGSTQALAPQAGGKVVVLGHANHAFGLARYLLS